MRRFLIASVSVLVLALTSYPSVRSSAGVVREAEDKLREFVPNLSALEEKFPEDSQVLLGLATVYKSHGSSFEYRDKTEQLYRRILDVDPDNKAVRAALTKAVVGNFTSRRGRLLTDLEMKQEYATRENLREVEIPSWSSLYDWLREESQDRVVIRNFDQARARLCEKLDRDLPAVIYELEKAEETDPANALYNYWRAQLNFDLGKDAEGLTEMERGADKPYLDNYWIPITDALKRVFQEAGFPERYWENILSKYRRLGGGPSMRKVFELAKQEQASQNFKKAAVIYEAVIRLGNQYREEPVPGQAGQAATKRGNNEYSERIARQAKEGLIEIQNGGYITESSDQLKDEQPVWTWTPFLIGTAFGMGVVLLALLLSKRAVRHTK